MIAAMELGHLESFVLTDRDPEGSVDPGSTMGILLEDAETDNPLNVSSTPEGTGIVLEHQISGVGDGPDRKSLAEKSRRTGIKFKASLDEDARFSEKASGVAPSNHHKLIENWLFRSQVAQDDFKEADQEPFFIRKSPVAAYSRAQFSKALSKDGTKSLFIYLNCCFPPVMFTSAMLAE